MLDSVSSKLIAEWRAFEMLEPWGDEWRQTARICTLVANAISAKRKFHEKDFMPQTLEIEQEVTEDQIMAMFSAFPRA